MSKYNSKSGSNVRKITLITILVFGIITVGVFTLSSINSGKDIQEVISNLPNDKLLGLSNLLSNENNKATDELLNKIEKMNKKLFKDQEERLDKIEQLQAKLLKEIKSLKSISPKSSIREKLTFLYPYDPTVKFPAYIWQSWKHGLNDPKFEEKFKDGESQWAFKNPGFVHELFNDDTALAVVNHLYSNVAEVIDTYVSLPEVILKQDFFKYLILFAKGGVYADIDTYPLQPIPNWTPENVSPLDIGMIVAIELDSNSPNWKTESIRRLQFGQFVIQAKPGHPILREAIASIIEYTQKLKIENNNNDGDGLKLTGNSNKKSLKISSWTGSGLWTNVIMKYFNDYIQSSVFQKITWKDFKDLKIPKLVSDILVLPINSFASDIEISNDGKIDDHLAFVKHYAAKIWKSG
ncbi:unnamed protein product [Candida verbasci]|uniref:Glycosyltransferase HOC1 n=1 Tax=Candida verbasci TaxID=1227364 RepID=A0A9W4TYF8_9ASCO|nr:unnamed protein product [Candida verbasci]